jgi:hypothetical protein
MTTSTVRQPTDAATGRSSLPKAGATSKAALAREIHDAVGRFAEVARESLMPHPFQRSASQQPNGRSNWDPASRNQ